MSGDNINELSSDGSQTATIGGGSSNITSSGGLGQKSFAQLARSA